jgi:hypothetical protein
MGWIDKVLAGGATSIIDSVIKGVDTFVTSDEDKQKLTMLKAQADLDVRKLVMNAETERLKDVQSARIMYATDNLIQKILALLFTVSFFGFMIFLLFLLKDATLTGDQTNLIYAMFGAVSGIMVTIIGFYFGSSQGSKDKDATFSNDMEKILSAARAGKKVEE